MKTALILALTTLAALSAYATQRPQRATALPAVEGPIPQIIIVAPRVADEQR